MKVQRHAHVVDLLHELLDRVLRKRRLAAPVLLPRRPAQQIGLGEIGRAALRRSVDGDLHAADLEAIGVGAERRGRIAPENLVELGDERIGDDVDQVRAFRRRSLHQREFRGVRCALVRGRHAMLRVEQLSGARPFHFLLGRGLWQRAKDRQIRRLHDEPERLVASRPPHDDAARRRLGVSGNVPLREGGRVEHGAVHRHVAHKNGVIGKRLVEMIPRELVARGHDVLVIAIGLDDHARRYLFRVAKLHQFGDDAVWILARPGGRRIHVDLVGDAERTEIMAVPVDEARQQRASPKVDDLRLAALVIVLDAPAAAHRKDAAVADRHRLRARLALVHRDDGPADIDGVRSVGVLRLRPMGEQRRARRRAQDEALA